ncbi:hypothetical protein WR25_23712 [Diploscapter pachys]|uniref:Uncharacterized protein n=1 Tax=Diploscapter pachys TaxID=2018661 RepID=A0A2A2JDK1_9BILA|nr:hypothetical protein WR25_23712 [Diploscapter pachys]
MSTGIYFTFFSISRSGSRQSSGGDLFDLALRKQTVQSKQPSIQHDPAVRCLFSPFSSSRPCQLPRFMYLAWPMLEPDSHGPKKCRTIKAISVADPMAFVRSLPISFKHRSLNED